MCQIEQNCPDFDVMLGEGKLMNTRPEDLQEASLRSVREEMAIPRMAKSVQRAIAWQHRNSNRRTSFSIEALPKISFDFSGAVTLDESFGTGETIFSQGDLAETLMYIRSGRVKLSVASKTGKEGILAILGPGEFLGETCLGSQSTRIRTATAITPTALQVIERNEMLRALHADRTLSDAFLSYMLTRNIRIEENLVDQVSQGCEKRLARALLLLAGKGNHRKQHKFAGISQQTLARMIGTTRSRVNFFMNKFRMRGLIKYHGLLNANGGLHINTSRLTKAFCK
jgi:CRP-like cAMP-binding protein